MNTLFSVDCITFAYPGHAPCLLDVSFSVLPGERLALLGANGCGKSTLLHLLDGLYFPAAGNITAFDTPLTEENVDNPPFGPQFRQRVGFLFQNTDAMLFCPTVEEELAFGPLQLQLPREVIKERIGDTLKLLELTHLRHRAPQTLSNGQQKRVGLAALLMVQPTVLLLDEPTAGLDPRSQTLLLDMLEKLHSGGMTLITATHDLELIPHLADRCLLLGEDHRVAAEMPASALNNNMELLQRVNLVHQHPHKHGDTTHLHPHQHIVGHEHEH